MKRDGSGKSSDTLSHAVQMPVSTPVRAQLYFVLVASVLLSAHVGASGRTVAQQLQRMADAMGALSFEGTLVYMHDNRLETLRIVHRVENGQLHEQLLSLNGPERAVTRGVDRVTCELNNAFPFSVQRHGVARDVFRSKSIDPDALAAHYLMHPLGTVRVAGRQTDVVGIIPRDDLRYGYRFYLDLESGLPLKSELVDSAARPVEQVMFTSLELLPSEGPQGADIVEVADRSPEQPGATPPDQGPWHFDGLPLGFELVMHDRLRGAAGKAVEHFVLSDGLASVSVYVEDDVQEGLEGSTRIGAIHAAGGRVSGRQVTVVGEVPPATVDAVLAGVRHVDGVEQ